MINIVIPMAGLGSRFSSAGYLKPKPFIDVLGKPMIARVMENLAYLNARFILIARKEHIEQEQELVQELEQKYNAIFIPINQVTEGAACTVLFAREYINNDDPLLIANSDQIVDISVSDYINDCLDRKLDGSILTFIDEALDPKWSFARINSSGIVEEVKEKKPISKYATVGIYFFTKGNLFVNSAIDMIIRNDRSNNEFYVCPVYNYAIEKKSQIGIYNINHEEMHGIGTPADLHTYIQFSQGK